MAFTRVSRREDSLTRGSAITGTVPWRVHGFDRVVLIRTKGVIIDVLQKVTSLESGRTVESSGTNRCRRSLFPGPGTKGGHAFGRRRRNSGGCDSHVCEGDGHDRKASP